MSARILTFKLLVNFFWLVITATANLHSVVNRVGFHNFWTHKSEGRFEQFPSRIFEDSDSEYFGWYFRHFCQYPEEVTDIWKQVQNLLLPHSLKFTSFNFISLRVYVLMCSVLTLICHSGHRFESYKDTCFHPIRTNPFQDYVWLYIN